MYLISALLKKILHFVINIPFSWFHHSSFFPTLIHTSVSDKVLSDLAVCLMRRAQALVKGFKCGG